MRKVLICLVLSLLLAACNGMPPTVVVVVSPTPNPNVIQITVTPNNNNAVSAGITPSATTVAQAATGVATTAATETLTATPGPTATPNIFPTETRAQLYIAQEDFQHGFMFWISSIKVVWVLNTSATDPNSGTWQTYQDTFVDGQPETDPSLTPPQGMYQPRRGFGKLWRETAGLRDALGWGLTPEYDLNTTYVYVPGGTVEDGKYIAGPGTHYVTALSKQTFALTQSATDPAKGTWKREP